MRPFSQRCDDRVLSGTPDTLMEAFVALTEKGGGIESKPGELDPRFAFPDNLRPLHPQLRGPKEQFERPFS